MIKAVGDGMADVDCAILVVEADTKFALEEGKIPSAEEALLEQKRAMDDVKKEIVTVASLMAQKVVSASIDTEIQDTLVEETLKEMGDSTWLS
jgi:F-type H+-transporting ATPase subunit b